MGKRPNDAGRLWAEPSIEQTCSAFNAFAAIAMDRLCDTFDELAD